MEALISYVVENGLRVSLRPNVANIPVPTLTLGIVNKRSEGFGISAATSEDKFELLRLAHVVASDQLLAGHPPQFYTSICINYNFSSMLHVDKHNGGMSHIVTGGVFSGGELFVVQEDGDGQDAFIAEADIKSGPWNISAGDVVKGYSHNIKLRWHQLDGRIPHGVKRFEGTRISVVFFCASLSKVSHRDKKVLSALGFPLPVDLLPLVPTLTWELPFRVFICSTRRSSTIMTDSLNVLTREGMPLSAVTLCVRDRVDVDAYEHLGLNLIVDEDRPTEVRHGGLPEQRKLCLLGRPNGSWNLFIDDDLRSILRLERYSHMRLSEIVIYGFLVAARENINLWGLNTSSDQRNLRDNMSRKIGLVNGYFFGLIHQPENPELTCSERASGAGEAIERSLRFYVHRGIIRFNAFTAVARIWSNVGGLQFIFSSSAERKAAHDFCMAALKSEFPEYLDLDQALPNRMRFLQRAHRKHQDGEQQEDEEDEAGSSCNCEDKSRHDALAPPQESQEEEHREKCIAPPDGCREKAAAKFTCDSCERTYKRKVDLVHHRRIVHSIGGHLEKHACTHCGRLFLRHKDCLVHERGQECHSRRGRWAIACVDNNNGEVRSEYN